MNGFLCCTGQSLIYFWASGLFFCALRGCHRLTSPPGLGTLCLITDPRLGIREGLGSAEFGTAIATRSIRRQLGLLWALKQGLVVAAVYTAAAIGVGTVFWATAGTAAGLYVLSYLLVADRLAAIENDAGFGVGPRSQPSPIVFTVAYVSVVNWALANPYRTGTGPKVLYAIALLASLVAAAIIAGTLTVDGPLMDAWGCYPVYVVPQLHSAARLCPGGTDCSRSATPLEGLDSGMCPASPLGSYRTCLSLPGTSLCETLKGRRL